MDWSRCPDAESEPEIVSGAWVVKGTRVQADSVIENYDEGFSPEEIVTDIFPGMTVEAVRRILTFAGRHAPHPA